MARTRARAIAHRFPADARLEGAGTHVTRWFVPSDYALTDPFLLFDETKSDKIEEYAGGFPEHPHRGFEALTYMIAGSLQHRDSAGYSGHVGPGGAQWLTNASGLTHDEVPDQTDGLFWCLQLWINLPAEKKFDTPFYSEAVAEQIPRVELAEGVRVRVVAGRFGDVRSPLPPRKRPAEPLYLDIELAPAAEFKYTPADDTNVLVFVVDGEITVQEETAQPGELLVLEKRGPVAIGASDKAHILLFAGRPIRQDIAWHGPFVMSNEAELEQAFEDFSRFGPFRSDAGTGRDNAG